MVEVELFFSSAVIQGMLSQVIYLLCATALSWTYECSIDPDSFNALMAKPKVVVPKKCVVAFNTEKQFC